MSQGNRVRQVYMITDSGREAMKDVDILSSDWNEGLSKLNRIW